MVPTPTELRRSALALASRLDPDTMSGEAAARAVQELSVAEKAVATTRMFLALRVAKTDAWRGQGHGSAADWLAAQCGLTVTEAHRQLGTAQKAKKLSKTKKAMDEGKLSPGQADSVTNGASADPTAEDDLLSSAANDTAKNLKDKAAKARAAATDTKERHRRIRRERTMRMRTDADGAFNLWLKGPALDGARLAAMLKPFQEEAFRTARSRWTLDGVKDTFDNREYDAFFNLLDHLSNLAATATHLTNQTPNTPDAPAGAPPPGSPPPGSPSPGAPPDPLAGLTDAQRRALTRKLPGGNNTKIIINIDLTALRRGHTTSGETCHIEGLGPIPVEVAQQLLSDAFIAAVIKDGTTIGKVTHLGRGLNAHQRTAIETGGLRCTNIACNHTIAIQIDHRTPYATNPITHLANQDPLCPQCHRQKTHHGWHLQPGTGPRPLLPPHHNKKPTPPKTQQSRPEPGAPPRPTTRSGGPGPARRGGPGSATRSAEPGQGPLL